MDKVKQFWKDVVKEREDYWCSFFRKYEENDHNVDINSYMDNSSNRIAALLKIASLEEQETHKANQSPHIQEFYEEQSSEPSDEDSDSRPLTPNEYTAVAMVNSMEKTTDNKCDILSTPQKKFEPSFIVEILDDEEETKAKLQLSPVTKKFKLFNSPTTSEVNNGTNPQNLNSSLNEQQITEPHECSMDDSKMNSTFNPESVRYTCKRRRFHSNSEASTLKRFKLA